MIVLVTTLFVIVISAILHRFYTTYVQRKKLQWMPGEMGKPLLGLVGEIKDNTKFIEVFSKYTRKHNGLCWLNMLTSTLILSTDYKFNEFFLSSNELINKGKIYSFFKDWLGQGLITSSGTRWRQMRKIVTPGFHFSILEQFVPIFESNFETLLAILKKESKKGVFNIAPFLTMYALDNICETAMGVKINAQVNPQSEYVNAVKVMCDLAVKRTRSLFNRFDLFYPLSSNYYKGKKASKMLNGYTNTVINSRRKELQKETLGNSFDDLGRKKKMTFIDVLLKSTTNGKPLSNEIIREEVNTFLFAGHDTTSSALSAIVYLLANYPEVQKRIVEEQKIIFADNIHRNATYSDLQEMKYLEKVIKEALRLYPSVPMVSRKINEDVKLQDGKIVPAGVEVVFYIYGVLRNPDVFPNPDTFDPDRFDNMKEIPPYAYIPFSAGPRNCIGQKFAFLQLKLTLSRLLRNFEIVAPGPGFEPIFTTEMVLFSLNGIHVSLKEIEIETK